MLIPGDTEDPGNSRRPELMVLDDLQGFIRSFAFAQSVHEELGESEIGIEEVEGALDTLRYSRILTVTISSNDAELVEAIAPAVEVVLADQINTFLIPEGGVPATVNIIDPAKAPEQDRTDMLFEILLVTSMGLLIGSLVAIGLASRDEDIQAA